VGDDYCGDPAQEAQGLNSVFATDTTTLAVVREQVERMKQVK
jgi:mannan endo-1,4-beta-mannosidase